MSLSNQLTQLVSSFLEQIEDCIGVIVADQDGLVIHSQLANKEHSSKQSVDEDQLAAMTSIVEPVLKKFTAEFKSANKKFGSATFETEQFRIIIASVEPYIYTFLIDQLGSIDRVFPYAYLVAEKATRLLNRRGNVELTIPKLGNVQGNSLKDLQVSESSEWAFKFILIGESGVGKTSLVSRFTENKFEVDFRPTIGLNVMNHHYNFLGYDLRMNIYDIGSQKMFKRVRTTYYKGTNAAMIVFDINNRDSFEKVDKWLNEMKKYVEEDVPFILVGNKADLKHEVSFQEATQKAESIGGSYIETSAKTAHNVEDAFTLICYRIISKIMDETEKKYNK